jgi:hypothetical protein
MVYEPGRGLDGGCGVARGRETVKGGRKFGIVR